MVIEGRIDRVQSRDFQHGIMKVECQATQGNVEIAKEALDLRKQYGGGGPIVSDNPIRDQHRPSWNTQLRPGQQIGHHDEAHDADVIHHRLLELLDPSKHMHPGIPYDFYSGYILMVADNIDTADNSGSGGYSSYNRNRNTPAEPTTFLYGKLTPDTVRDLRAKIGGFYEVSAKKHKLVQNPVDVLDILGQHSYRVIGFTAEADKKMVWTLEQKDFEGHL